MTRPDQIGRLLKIGEVERETALDRRTIYRRIRAGEFPHQIRLGPQRVAWAECDINAWKAQLLLQTG